MLLREPKICEMCKLNISDATLSREIRYFFADFVCNKGTALLHHLQTKFEPKNSYATFPTLETEMGVLPPKTFQMPGVAAERLLCILG